MALACLTPLQVSKTSSFPERPTHISTLCCLLLCFLAVLIASFPLSTLPLTSLLPFLSPCLISSIKALLSWLCQGGMLTTPGIVTLWEFTPLKMFYHLLLSLPFSLSFCCVYLPYFCLSSLFHVFFFDTHPWFFSSTQVHIDTCVSPPPPPLVSLCVRNTVAPAVW